MFGTSPQTNTFTIALFAEQKAQATEEAWAADFNQQFRNLSFIWEGEKILPLPKQDEVLVMNGPVTCVANLAETTKTNITAAGIELNGNEVTTPLARIGKESESASEPAASPARAA